MKKILLSIVVLIFSVTISKSQGLFIGVQGGLHNVWLSNVNPLWSSIDSLSKDKSKDKITSVGNVFRGSMGLQIGFDFTKHVGLVTELNYLGQGYKYQDSTKSQGIISGTYSSTYIQIPIMLKLTSGKDGNGIFLMAGPNYNLLQTASLTESSNKVASATTDLNAKNYLLKQDFGFTTVIGIQFKPTPNFQITFGFKGIFGLQDLNKVKSAFVDYSPPKVNNGSVGLNIGAAYHF